MARLVPLHQAVYQKLRGWVAGGLQSIPSNQKVWDAFLTCSGLAAAPHRARGALDPTADPIVFVEEMGPGVNGYFNPLQSDTVRVARSVVQPVETTSDPGALHLLESTVLHELVHWAWAVHGGGEPAGREMGEEFEAAAYGSASVNERRSLLQPGQAELGKLSRRFEAADNPGAIGFDRNGGWSYGLYQIASRVGTMETFLAFLGRTPAYQTHARRLKLAGGGAAARRGDAEFKRSWQELAVDPVFAEAQHRFVRATHYEPFVARLASEGLDVRPRSVALNDVAWSVSVQHGPARTQIFSRPWRSLPPGERGDDAALIRAVYRERSRVEVYFASASAAERSAVLRRFDVERENALRMLA
jgi:hypothetical protein